MTRRDQILVAQIVGLVLLVLADRLIRRWTRWSSNTRQRVLFGKK
jgi:hypothetical protein